MATAALLPVTVLTGFLGAGKTTLLNRLLREAALADTAVIVNEFGDVGLDHLLMETAEEGLVLLSGGCLCCSLRGDLVDTLDDLLARRDGGTLPAFRRVVIETSGLADPAPLIQTLIAHPGLAARLALDRVATIVDSLGGEAALAGHAESRRQVALADRLILSKTDLAPPAARLIATLRTLNPAAPMLPVEDVTAATLMGDGSWGDAALRDWLAAEAYVHAGAGPEHGACHAGTVRAFSIVTDRAITAASLSRFLDLLVDRHGTRLLRLKALIRLAEEPERPLVLHGVRHHWHEPARLAGWPDGDRRTRLVLIMDGVDPAAIERLFAAFIDEPRLDAPDRTALVDNPLAVRGG